GGTVQQIFQCPVGSGRPCRDGLRGLRRLAGLFAQSSHNLVFALGGGKQTVARIVGEVFHLGRQSAKRVRGLAKVWLSQQVEPFLETAVDIAKLAEFGHAAGTEREISLQVSETPRVSGAAIGT